MPSGGAPGSGISSGRPCAFTLKGAQWPALTNSSLRSETTAFAGNGCQRLAVAAPATITSSAQVRSLTPYFRFSECGEQPNDFLNVRLKCDRSLNP